MKNQHGTAWRVGFLVAMLSLLFAACVGEDEPENGEEGTRVRVGDTVPAFTVSLDDGSAFTSPNSLLGHETVLVFFTTTCPDCLAALPRWQQAYDGGQRIVCISRAEKAEDVAACWASLSLTMPYAAVPDRSVYNLFARSGVPRSYTVSPTGIITALTVE